MDILDLLELDNYLNIVFEKEESDIKKGLKTWSIEESDENILSYPNADTIINLFSIIKSNGTLKSYFIDRLKKRIFDSDEIMYMRYGGVPVGISPLCFYVLVELGLASEAITSLKRRHGGCEGFYSLIRYMMPKNYFDLAQLKEISTHIRTEHADSGPGRYLDSLIIESRFELLNRQIKKVNIEINQDKKVVSEKISMLGFDKSYNELLDGIDHFIYIETSKIVNAGMISNLRTFMGNLLKDVANRIAEKQGEKMPIIEGRGEMGNIRSYLKNKLELSDKDDKFIDSFVNILHSEGGHAFTSEKEYFRLARNIAIEIALFILSKYEKKFKL
jgi:hypothetical protein